MILKMVFICNIKITKKQNCYDPESYVFLIRMRAIKEKSNHTTSVIGKCLIFPEVVKIIRNKLLVIIKKALSIKFSNILNLGIGNNLFYNYSR